VFRNSKWGFLNGVKSSGAPPPRSVIVQQCIRDNSLLETLSNYVSFFILKGYIPLLLKLCVFDFLVRFQATPTKDFLHSRTVVCFCTAVIVECLGAIPRVDSDIVQKVLGYVFDSLNPQIRADQDYKVGLKDG
jgi:U3 small nucleolar RNA-associated protein 10